MALERRKFCLVLAGWSLAAPTGVRLADGASILTRRHREPNFFTWHPPHGPVLIADPPEGTALARALVIAGTEGALLINTASSGFGAQLRREASTHAKLPITHVINTSALDSFTGGNHAFRDVQIIAHAKAPDQIKKQTARYIAQVKEAIVALKGRPVPEDLRAEISKLHAQFTSITAERFLPTRTIDAPTDLDWPGPPVRIIPVAPACTASDLIVHLPERDTLIVGSLAWPGVHPIIDRALGANIAGWQSALDQALALCDDKTIVIASTGATSLDPAAPAPDAPPPLVGIEMLRAQADYFKKLRRIVVYAKDVESMPRKDVVGLTTGAFEGLGEDHRLKRNLGAMFDELAGQAAAPPAPAEPPR